MELKEIVLLILSVSLLNVVECVSPSTYYANIGESVTLQCQGGGMYACFSTYTYQYKPFQMVYLNNSAKYQIQSNSIVVNNVQATDAGFYACSSDCTQMKNEMISYFLQPMSMGQPVDTSKTFIPIPPFPEEQRPGSDVFYVVAGDESYYDAHAGPLSTGEIIGLVVGLLIALIVTVAIILLLVFLSRKRKERREKILEPGKKNNQDGTSVDYSTIERDFANDAGSTKQIISDRDGERKSLSSNKRDSANEINTKDIRGPNVYKPGDLINPRDLPNIDIDRRDSSQRSVQDPNRSHQGSYNYNPSNRSYQNQLDQPYQNQIPRPGRRESDVSGAPSGKTPSMRENSGILPPPPSKAPVNKIQFPSRQPPQPPQEPRYTSNENINLHQIIKDSGFLADVLDGGNDDYNQQNPVGQTGFYNTRNNENYQQYEDDPEQDQHEPHDSYRNRPAGVDIDSNGGAGGVTVVSARTPVRNEQGSNLTVLPPTVTRFNQQPQQQQQQQPSNRPLPPHLSYSQRIETTSTPLQIPPPSASLRAGGIGAYTGNNAAGHGRLSSNVKDGATDV